MKMREILEGDKERLMARLAKAENADRACGACEEELSRMLVSYQEEAPSEAAGELASQLLEVLRAALPFADCGGEIELYERIGGGSREEKKSPVLPGILALLCLVGGGAVITLAPKTLWVLAGVLAAAACFFALQCGLRAGRNGKAPERREVTAEMKPDAQKIYHTLFAAAEVCDRVLEDALLAERRKSGELHLSMDRKSTVPEEELSLLTTILESAYAAEAEDDAAQGIISEIRFYLHKRGVEMEECNDSNARWFTRMPGSRRRTVRPALVQNGTVLVKGLASGSYGEE